MELEEKIEQLQDKDVAKAYENLKQLEEIATQGNQLYPYFDEFLTMLESEKYVIRVRGFRLLCKQARWDVDHKINNSIQLILDKLEDEKPTAVRQYLQAMQEIVTYKKELHEKIKQKLLQINILSYKETMQGLIEKDIEQIMKQIEKDKG